MASIRFQLDPEKTVAAIVYLTLHHSSGLDKYGICKLLFLADKYHLVRYGRPITGDEYWALPFGPAPTAVLNQLNAVSDDAVDSDEIGRLANALDLDRTFRYPRFKAKIAVDLDCLSKSDIEALDKIYLRYGQVDFGELKSITHAMPAYMNAWNDRGSRESAPMSFEDFFEEDSDALAGVLEEMIEDAELREAFSV